MATIFFENRVGDALDLGRQLERDGIKVSCVLTSPPYFGLRDYGRGATASGEIGREADDDVFITHVADALVGIPTHPGASIWVNIGDTQERLRPRPHPKARHREAKVALASDVPSLAAHLVEPAGGDAWMRSSAPPSPEMTRGRDGSCWRC